VGHLREDGSGETRKLATHSGRAHKLALDPSAAAAFYSCGEDGVVRPADQLADAAANVNQDMTVTPTLADIQFEPCWSPAGRHVSLLPGHGATVEPSSVIHMPTAAGSITRRMCA